MEFGLSEEQTLLQDSVKRFLAEQCPLDTVRQYTAQHDAQEKGETGLSKSDTGVGKSDTGVESDTGVSLRNGLAQLGIPGLVIDEAYGGVDLGLLDAALVSEALGYGTAPAAFTASSVMVPYALKLGATNEVCERYLPRLANGEITAGAALSELSGARLDAGVTAREGRLTGKALFVLDFDADLYLAATNERKLYLVEQNASGLLSKPLTTVDRTRSVGELIFENTPATALDCTAAQVDQVVDAGRLMLAADSLGAAQNMLDQAVAYSLQREQFNRVIASFQAVKHMCAEMAAALEPCRAMVWYAAYAADAQLPEARQYACLTKAHLSEVGQFVARTATEVHGGMGFTDLLGLHYWFKRIGANRQYLGSPERLREEAARDQKLIV